MYSRSIHHRPTHSRGHPSPRPHRHWHFCDLHGILSVVALPHPMGSLKAFPVHGAHGKPLQISGKTQHLNLQWGEARGRACFIVIMGLKLPPCLIRKDIMRRSAFALMSPMAPLRPLNRIPKRSSSMQPKSRILLPSATSCALLLQTTDIPAETAQLVRCHNPWPSEDVYFSPEDALPAFVTGVPALSRGSEVWIAVHNHRPEPLRLHSGQNIGVLKVVTVADAKSSPTRPRSVCQPPIPEHLSPLQQQQLNNLFKEFSDVFSQGEDNLSCTPPLKHTIETQGPPLRQPYRWQNPAVRREEMAQVQQMLASNVIRPSNSPWASLVVMVKKKTAACASALTSVNLTQRPSKTRIHCPGLTTSSTHYTGLAGFPLWI